MLPKTTSGADAVAAFASQPPRRPERNREAHALKRGRSDADSGTKKPRAEFLPEPKPQSAGA